ncbi:hypothetical protein Droror1_Dr00007434 [Drosera rotundifolia]
MSVPMAAGALYCRTSRVSHQIRCTVFAHSKPSAVQNSPVPVELPDLAPQRVTPTNVVAERASSDPRRPSGEDVNIDINVADRQNSVLHTPGPWGGMDRDSIRWRLRHLQQQMRSQSSSSGPWRNSFVMLGFSAHLDEPHSSSRGDSSPRDDASSSCHRYCTEGRSQVTGDQVSFRSRVHSVVHCFRQIDSPPQDPGMWGATPRSIGNDGASSSQSASLGGTHNYGCMQCVLAPETPDSSCITNTSC